MEVKLLIIGNGFQYKNEAEELLALRRGKKVATTADMLAIRNSANVTRSVGSVNELVAVLREVLKNPGDSLKSLNIIGHSNGDEIAFKGKIVLDSAEVLSTGDRGESLTGDILKRIVRPHINDIRKREGDPILPNATITLYGCESGGAGQNQIYKPPGKLLQSVADTFGVTTYGFTKPLLTCVLLTPKRDKIIGRGWFRIDNNPRHKTSGPGSCEKVGFTDQLDDLKPDASFQPS